MELFYITLNGEIADAIRERDDLVAHGVMKYDMLYSIYEPGLLVYMEHKGQDLICKVESVEIDDKKKDSEK